MSDDSITVLHVDDDELYRDFAKTCLQRADPDITVISEPSAAAGLDTLQQRRIDCIVSDYDMTPADGLEFLESVRDEYPSLPFVLYTGKGSEEVAEKAINSGADAYHQKQSGLDQYTILAQHINTLVEKYWAKRRLDHLEREKHIADGGVTAVENRQLDEQAGSISLAVVKKVAAREGIDPVALSPPLYEVIDPAALDALFPPYSEDAERGAESVTFTYCDYTITLSEDGQILLEE